MTPPRRIPQLKRTRTVRAVLVLLLLVPACLLVAQTDQLNLAGRIVTQFFNGEDDAVREYFGPRLIKSLSPEQMTSMRESLTRRGGAVRYVQTAIRATSIQDGRLTQAAVPVEFDNFSVEVLMTWNGGLRKGSVEGFAVRPLSPPARPDQQGQSVSPFQDAPYLKPETYREERVQVGDVTAPVPARLVIPSSAADGRKLPVVVIVSSIEMADIDGSIGPNKMWRDVAHGLGGRGVLSLRYANALRRDGSLAGTAYGVNQVFLDDLYDACVYIAARPEVDQNRIYILAHGEAASVVPMFATRIEGIRGVILLSPPARYDVDYFLARHEVEGTRLRHTDAEWRVIKGSALFIRDQTLDPSHLVIDTPASYWYSLQGYEAAEAVRDFRGDVLLLFGGRDYLLGPREFGTWGDVMRTESNVHLEYLPSLNRWLMPSRGNAGPDERAVAAHVDPLVIDLISEFLAQSE